MDNDFPSRMAGGALGLSPLDLKEGLSPTSARQSLNALRPRSQSPLQLVGQGNPMAPERSEPGFSLRGGYQPEVAYGA